MSVGTKLSRFCNILSKCRSSIPPHRHFIVPSATKFKTFEPDYLDVRVANPTSFGGSYNTFFLFQTTQHLPKVYPPINIQMKGHNFDVLESYQSFVHNLVENMGIDCSDSWASPGTTIVAKTYDINSTIVKDSCPVNSYERNVQVSNLRSIDASLLIDLLRRTLPEGVELSVHEHTEEHYEARFIPDPFISGLKEELRQMEDERAKQADEKMLSAAEKEARREKRKLDELYSSLDEEDDDDL